MDQILLLGMALATGGLLCVAPWELACTAGLFLLLVGRRLGMGFSLLLCVALGWNALRAVQRVTVYEHAREAVRQERGGPVRCAGEAVVIGSPMRLRGAMRWQARFRALDCDTGRVGQETALLYGGPEDLAHGDVVEVIAQLALPQRFWNEGTGDPRPSDARRGVLLSGGVLRVDVLERGKGVVAWIDRMRAHARVRIDATFPEMTSGMARALVLGEEDLNVNDMQAFRTSGLAHLLAVSGAHLVLVVVVLIRALRFVLVRIETLAGRMEVGRLTALLGIPLTWGYAVFAGASDSAVRAAWMLTATLAAQVLGRAPDTLRALGISMGVMALVDPFVLYSFSFSLSVAAVGGLIAFAVPMHRAMQQRLPAWLSPLSRLVSSSLAATIACLPLLARIGPTLPLGGILANVLAVPLGEVAALPLCLLHGVLVPWPDAEQGMALAASGALSLVLRLAHSVTAISWLSPAVPMPTALQVALVTMLLTGGLLVHGRRRHWFLGCTLLGLIASEFKAYHDGHPKGILRATFLDVGQGDAALVDFPDGTAWLIDGGGIIASPTDIGASVLTPFLRARRRTELAVVMVSHPHPDHYLGLITALPFIRVGSVWENGQGERDKFEPSYLQWIETIRRKKIPIFGPHELCGTHAVGGARLTVLAPCPALSPTKSTNDNSFVVHIRYGQRSVLFSGDAEHATEAELVAREGTALHADILKVGHHGSRTSSTPSFLAAVAPTDAVISVGIRNRYGHPHPLTLAVLNQAHTRVWRTDETGATLWSTDGTSMHILSLSSR